MRHISTLSTDELYGVAKLFCLRSHNSHQIRVDVVFRQPLVRHDGTNHGADLTLATFVNGTIKDTIGPHFLQLLINVLHALIKQLHLRVELAGVGWWERYADVAHKATEDLTCDCCSTVLGELVNSVRVVYGLALQVALSDGPFCEHFQPWE